MADERKVAVDLEVTRSGETGAFQQTARDVRDLRSEAEAATPAVEELGESTSDAGDAASEAGGQFGELGDSAGDAGSKLGNAAASAVAVAAAFKAGWEAGTVLREVLNDITKGGFDRSIQGILTSVLGLEDGLDSDVDAAQRLQNQLRILKANGIDPVGLSAEEVEKKVGELAKTKSEAAKQSEELQKAETAWAEKLGLSNKALDESSKKLATYVADFAKQNSQLSQTDLAKIFGPMVQEVLDNYERLGKEAPLEVKKLADGWNILTTSAQEAANEQKKIVDDMVADITGAAAGLKGSLEAQLKTLDEVFSKIDFGSLGAEQIEKAKTFLQQYVDTSRKAGQQIPEDVADQAAAMGILVSAMEVAGKANEGLRGTQEELNSVVVGTSQTFNAQGQEISRLSTITNQAGTLAKTAGSQIKEGGDQAGEAVTPIRNVTEEVNTLVQKLRDAAASSKTAGTEVKEGADAAGEGAKSLQQAAAAGEAAGTGIGSAKTAAEGLGTAGEAARTAATNLKAPLADLGTAGTTAATALSSIETTVNRLNGLNLSALVASLKAVETQARATKAAIDSIDGEGGAASPADSPGTGDAGSGGGGGGGF